MSRSIHEYKQIALSYELVKQNANILSKKHSLNYLIWVPKYIGNPEIFVMDDCKSNTNH